MPECEQAASNKRPKVMGVMMESLPQDLYIPPDALEVFLESFEGPLDLLLYLIRRQNIDILDIPVVRITAQYMAYIEVMQGMRFELAAEYLLMAAMLAEIKSRLLLPRPAVVEGGDDDPRADLVRQLQAYEQFKQAAARLDALPRMGRDTALALADTSEFTFDVPLPDVQLASVLQAFRDVMRRASLVSSHHVQMEPLSVRARMTRVLSLLETQAFVEFDALFNVDEGRKGVVVSFIAILELLKGAMIDIVQSGPLQPIHVRLVTVDKSRLTELVESTM
jgi:segregation and condensation protein A